jgi:hypothetical protein
MGHVFKFGWYFQDLVSFSVGAHVIRPWPHFCCPLTFFFSLIIYGSCFQDLVSFSVRAHVIRPQPYFYGLLTLFSLNIYGSFFRIYVSFSVGAHVIRPWPYFYGPLTFFSVWYYLDHVFSVFAGFAQFLSVTSYNLVHISV